MGLILLEAQVGQNHLHSQELSPTFSDSADCSLINYLKPSSETSHQFPNLSDFVKKANRSGKGAQGRPLTGMSLTGGAGWDVPGLRGKREVWGMGNKLIFMYSGATLPFPAWLRRVLQADLEAGF